MAVNNIENNTDSFNTEISKEVAEKATFEETLRLLFPGEKTKKLEDKSEEVGWDWKKEKTKLKKESEAISITEQEKKELDGVEKEKEKVISLVVKNIRKSLGALEDKINEK